MHPIPVRERISFLYFEHGTLERQGNGLCFSQIEGAIQIPAGNATVLLMGPGTTVTHAAISLCGAEGCLIIWTGENGVRLYGAGNPRGNGQNLLKQAAFALDPSKRLIVARKMYREMFGNPPPQRLSINQLRGVEGAWVKKWYQNTAERYNISWTGRSGNLLSPIEKSIAGANAALYGLCEGVILSLGFSPSIGFIHQGGIRSFVYDIADTVKFTTVAPLAFHLAQKKEISESVIRQACRSMFFETKLAGRLVNILDGIFDDSDL